VGHEITDDAFTDALNLRIRLLREKSGMVDGGDVAAFERRRAV